MAILKVGKNEINGIATLSIKNSPKDPSKMILSTIGYQGSLRSITLPKYDHIRIEVRPGDNEIVSDVNADNTLTVIGNVTYAEVDNVLTVEGFVNNFDNMRDKISVDKSIKVTYGAERNRRTYWKSDNPRAHVIRVNGGLRKLTVDLHNTRVETVILGNVNYATVGNCMDVKGVVNNCTVGNIIYSTMGKSLAKSTSTIVKERKQIRNDMHKDFTKLASGLKSKQ